MKKIYNLGDNNLLNSSSIYQKIADNEEKTSEFINNKRVYCRRYSHKFQTSTECTFAHNLDLSKIEIVRFDAYCARNDGNLYFPLPCPRLGETQNYWFEFYIDNTNFVVLSGDYDRSNFISYITIYYIKK